MDSRFCEATRPQTATQPSYASSTSDPRGLLSPSASQVTRLGLLEAGITRIHILLQSSSFNNEELRSCLGSRYLHVLEAFFAFQAGNEGYSAKSHLTKTYVLRPETHSKLAGFWADSRSAVIRDRHTGRTLTASDFPAGGVQRPMNTGLHVPAILPIALTHVDGIISEYEEWQRRDAPRSAYHLQRRASRGLPQLYIAKQYIQIIGGLPNLYADTREDDGRTSGNGRLWGVGDFSLQRCPKDVRARLLAAADYWDHDFENCHPTIAAAMARAYGIEAPTLTDFVLFRKERVDEIAEAIDVRASALKKVFLGMINGQPLSTSPQCKLVGLIGEQAVERMQASPYIREFKKDVALVRKAAVARHRRGYTVANAVGKRLDIRQDCPGRASPQHKKRIARSRKSLRILFSHILQGYEAAALRIACKRIDSLVVIIHDGFVTRGRIDTQSLEAALQEAVFSVCTDSLSLKLKSKRF